MNTLNYLLTNFKEPFLFLSSLQDQEKTFRRSNWLYRYSNANRAFLKTSQDSTQIKNLLGNGFYNQKIAVSNLWTNTEVVKKRETSNLIKTLSQTNFISEPFLKTQPGILNKNTITSLISNYEESYFWFLQRTSHFNNSRSNNLESTLILSSQPNLINYYPSNLDNLSYFISQLNKSKQINEQQLSGQLLFLKENQEKKNNISTWSRQDYFLSYKVPSLFSESVSDLFTQLLRTNAYIKKTFCYTPFKELNFQELRMHYFLKEVDEIPNFFISPLVTTSKILVNETKEARLNYDTTLLSSNEDFFYRDLLTYSILFKK